MATKRHLILLFGPYRAPRHRRGATVQDACRGEVIVTGLTDAPIPWPLGKLPGGRKPGLIVFSGLERALRTEVGDAVAHWWGVTAQTVTKWRKLLDFVGTVTPGTSKRRRDVFVPRWTRCGR